MTFTPGKLDSTLVSPVLAQKPKHTPAAVLFAPKVEVIVSTPARSSRMVGPVSPDLRQPSRELSLVKPGPVVITIAPPAYVSIR